jgi:hypothetical protein
MPMNPENLEDFEARLRAAMRREAAPPDFAANLKAKLPERRPTAIWRRPAAWAIAAALLLAALLPPAVSEFNSRRRARAIEATRQVLLALKITNTQLRRTREKVQQRTQHAL